MHIATCRMSWLPSYVSNYRTDKELKICLLTGGSVLWEIEGKDYEVHTGDIVLLDSSVLRRFKRIIGPQSLDMLIVMFSQEVLQSSKFIHMFFNAPQKKNHIVRAEDVKGLTQILLEIEEEYNAKQLYYMDAAQAKIENALALIARHTNYTPDKPNKNFSKIYTSISYIDANYTAPLTLSQLANAADMSPSAFSKAFLKCTGIGVTQYILRRRIEQAITLLENTDRNVLDIALECGFNNGAAFYQAFKKLTGNIPKQYKK